MDSTRLKKLEGQFKKDLSEILQNVAQNAFRGKLLSVTNVKISPDLSLARINVSMFPVKNPEEIIEWLTDHKGLIKNDLVKKLQGQLRKMPDLIFHLDDSIEQEAAISRILKEGGESPIQ